MIFNFPLLLLSLPIYFMQMSDHYQILCLHSLGWDPIYDDYNKEILDLIGLLIVLKIPVFILSTREPSQIIEWWNKKEFSIKAMPISEEITFWKELKFIGVTI